MVDNLDNDLLQFVDPDSNFLVHNFRQLIDNQNSSPYYTIEQFNNLFDNCNSSFFLNLNIRSFQANKESFYSLLSSLKIVPKVIIMTETWLSEESLSLCTLDGYIGYHTVRIGRRSGGVSIFVQCSIHSEKIETLSISDDVIESCTVKLRFAEREIFVLGLYRPQGPSLSSFNEKLIEILNNSPHLSNKALIAGDLNINLLDHENSYVCEFMCNLQSLQYLPVITKPTRMPNNNQTPSLLDHIWLNFLTRYNSGILLTDLVSDHCPTFINIPSLDSSPRDKIKIRFRYYGQQNTDRFRRQISSVCWNNLLTGTIDEKVETFSNKLKNLYFSNFPIMTKFVSAKRLNNPWLSSGILKSIKTKSEYFKMYKLGFISQHVNKKYKNMLTKIIKKAKQFYFHKSFLNCKSDVKKTWKLLNSLLSSNRNKSKIKSILINNELVSDDETISREFCNYFSSIANDLERDIPLPQISSLDSLNPNNQNSFFLKPVQIYECISLISALKNTSCNIHSVPVHVYKSIKTSISVPISCLINECFSSGIFPKCLKRAHITPILKSGSPQLVSNFRPISVLPILSKIFERAIASRLSNFIHKFSIISLNQFGFQKNKSTVDAIINLIEHIYSSLDKKHHTIGLFIDLKKAFDTVNHPILLRKLSRAGIRGLPLKLFESYLKDREQCVRLGSVLSDWRTVNIGVPQGSVLAPLLFILYINDLPLVPENLSTILFADDTTIFGSASTLEPLLNLFNNELVKIYNWTCENRLSLNISKTHAILFSNRIRSENIPLNLNLQMNQQFIDLVENGKFLGVTIDSRLTFSQHIKTICAKLSKTVGIFHRLQSDVPLPNLINLYYSLFYPYLLYCNMAWGGAYESHLKPVILLQKKIIRIIMSQHYLAHTNDLFFQSKILKFNDIHKFIVCLYVHKNLNKFLNQNQHPYATRSRDLIVPHFHRLTLTQRSISYIGPRFWNTLPPDLRNIDRFSEFKNKLKIFFINQYSG